MTEALNAAVASARLHIRADEAGGLALLPEGGTWGRLKTCAECHWALYDRTRNRSAAWCDPAKCGVRVRVRRYRRRRREASA